MLYPAVCFKLSTSLIPLSGIVRSIYFNNDHDEEEEEKKKVFQVVSEGNLFFNFKSINIFLLEFGTNLARNKFENSSTSMLQVFRFP